ncbi:MAG: hypothetical protein JNJ50_04425 [Acidobacteria bacterium]|nr:hypothetical protein [Acidobacteriota bacterium]
MPRAADCLGDCLANWLVGCGRLPLQTFPQPVTAVSRTSHCQRRGLPVMTAAA